MVGWRCEACREVRWSLLGREEEAIKVCPACGTRMTEERRRPGRRAAARRASTTERRDAPTAV